MSQMKTYISLTLEPYLTSWIDPDISDSKLYLWVPCEHTHCRQSHSLYLLILREPVRPSRNYNWSYIAEPLRGLTNSTMN